MISTLKPAVILMTLALTIAACTGGTTTPVPATGVPSVPAPTSTAVPETDAPETDAPETDAPETDAPTDEPASPSADPGEPSASPSPSPAPGAEEGTLTIWADNIRAPLMEEFRQAFEAEYEVPVQVYQLGFGDIRDQLVLRGPLGEGPDLIIGAHDWLGELVTNGVVAPLDLGDAADNIDPVALQAFTYDGQLYGLPYAQEAIALYYNADLVPTPPATWEELKTIARDLQADGTVEQAYLLQQADPYHSYPILSGMGGYIFGQDAEGNYDPSDVGLDSEGGLAYARELDSMVKEGLLRAGVDYGAAEAMMHDGSAAMWITGPWALTGMRDSGQNIQVAQIPTIDGTAAAPFVGVHAFMVSADAPNQLLAEAFLTEFVATDQSMAALFDADPRPPTWLPLRELIADEAIAEFTESASQGNPMPAIPEMSAVWESWTDAINFIFDQTQDAEQAARDAAENIRTDIGD